MTSCYAEFEKHNPLRALDWRWRRAHELLAGGRRFSAKRDDLITGRALRYLRARGRCTSERAMSRLARDFPDIVEACAIKRNRPLDLEIEARLLSGQNPSDIAELTGATIIGIAAYEELFFNVLDRLDTEDYILAHAIRPSILANLFEGDFGTMVRRYAYFGGPEILDVMLQLARRRRQDGSFSHDLTTAEGRQLFRAELAMTIDGLSTDGEAGWRFLRVLPDLLAMLDACAPRPTMLQAFAAIVPAIAEETLLAAAQEKVKRSRAARTRRGHKRSARAA